MGLLDFPHQGAGIDFRAILPGSHLSAVKTSQVINHSMAILCQQLNYMGICVQGTEKGTAKQRKIGTNRKAFGARENSRQEGTEDHSSEEGWAEKQWNRSSWQKHGAGKSWGSRTRTSACICLWYWTSACICLWCWSGRLKIKYILIFKWGATVELCTLKSLDACLWTFGPCHLSYPLAGHEVETMHQSQKVSLKVLFFDEYIVVKENSLGWKIPSFSCEIWIIATPLSLSSLCSSLIHVSSSHLILLTHYCLVSLSFAVVAAASFLLMWQAQLWANVNSFPRNASQNIGWNVLKSR